MILLDTDHLNILQIGKGPQYETLAGRIDAAADQRVATTVITFEEHMRGWLASIRRATDIAQQLRPYDQLIALIRFYQAWEIVGLDTATVDHFENLRKQRIRIGTMDLKIASIALANNATLLTANRRDFVTSTKCPAFNSKTGSHNWSDDQQKGEALKPTCGAATTMC